MKMPVYFLVACTIAESLVSIRPGAQWNLRGDTLAGLEWLDKVQSVPSQAEIDAAIATCRATPIPLTADQRIANLEAAVTQISDVTNVSVNLPTTQANIAP